MEAAVVSPLVTIVIPTKNRRELLARSVASCLGQTYASIEVVIVDDGSTDGTEAYLNSLTDPRIVCLRKPVSEGMAAALNAGFARAGGEYFTWSSDDDYYAPEAVAKMVATLEADRTVDFVYAHYSMVDENGRVLRAARVEEPEMLDRDNYVGHCFLYRRRVYETVGEYRASAFLVEDYDYWLRVRRQFRMKRLPETLYCHALHPDSLTLRYGADRVQGALARTRWPYISRWLHYFLAAERCYHAGRRAEAVGNVLVSLVFRPWHPASWRIFALALLPKAILGRMRK